MFLYLLIRCMANYFWHLVFLIISYLFNIYNKTKYTLDEVHFNPTEMLLLFLIIYLININFLWRIFLLASNFPLVFLLYFLCCHLFPLKRIFTNHSIVLQVTSFSYSLIYSRFHFIWDESIILLRVDWFCKLSFKHSNSENFFFLFSIFIIFFLTCQFSLKSHSTILNK